MRQIGIVNRLALSAIACLVLLGCGNGGDASTVPTPEGWIAVEGTVVGVENMVPVDGGVTIEVALVEGATETLWFPSLYTDPPPTEEILRLYDVVRRVEVGDHIRAEGDDTPAGLRLVSLAIVSGQP